jgi:hypothetical protein
VGTTGVILESRVRCLRCVQLKAAGDVMYCAVLCGRDWCDTRRADCRVPELVGLESGDGIDDVVQATLPLGNNRHGREMGIRRVGDDVYRDWEIRYDEEESLQH